MQTWPCQFIATNALDGFMYYTWGAWYSTDLINHSELWPEMNNIYNNCVNQPGTITPTPTIPSCDKQGDLNCDGKVNIFDFNILIINFGRTGDPGFTPADINKSGQVDLADFVILVTNFGQ
jgi:hypothetical protein